VKVKRSKETFGNDKVLTSLKARSAYAISQGDCTIVLLIPVKTIETILKKIENSGENYEKQQYFKEMVWYRNFTQA
jgi:hypothetical protein